MSDGHVFRAIFRGRSRVCGFSNWLTKRDSSAASCSAISGPMWSRSSRRAANRAAYRAVSRRHPASRAQPVVLVLQHLEARHHAEPGDRRRPCAIPAPRGTRMSSSKPSARGSWRLSGSVTISARRQPRADPLRADPVRPDRPVAGLSLERPAAHGGRRRDGVLWL